MKYSQAPDLSSGRRPAAVGGRAGRKKLRRFQILMRRTYPSPEFPFPDNAKFQRQLIIQSLEESSFRELETGNSNGTLFLNW